MRLRKNGLKVGHEIMSRDIIHRKELVGLIVEACNDLYPIEVIEDISDLFMQILIECFKTEKSLLYKDEMPMFKVKRSVANINVNSPRAQRNDRIIVSMKISLSEKSVREK